MKNFGSNLKYYRKDSGLRQEDLAKAISVTRQTINNYEKGKTFPRSKYLTAIAKALDTSVEALLEDC